MQKDKENKVLAILEIVKELSCTKGDFSLENSKIYFNNYKKKGRGALFFELTETVDLVFKKLNYEEYTEPLDNVLKLSSDVLPIYYVDREFLYQSKMDSLKDNGYREKVETIIENYQTKSEYPIFLMYSNNISVFLDFLSPIFRDNQTISREQVKKRIKRLPEQSKDC